MNENQKLAAARVAMYATYYSKVCDKLDRWLETKSEKDFEALIAQHNHTKDVVERLQKIPIEAKNAQRNKK